jgi:N12 class adenine-specific DNA methylase
VPLRSSRPRYSAPGQLVLFDLLNPPPSPEPGTILTPRQTADDTEQQLELSLTPPSFDPPVAELAAPGLVTATLADQPAASPIPTDSPNPEHDPYDSADAAPLVSFPIAPTHPAVQIAPDAEDHICTPADFLTSAAERFEANIAAISLLKNLEEEGSSATSEDQAVLARFNSFGDATFEPAFRLSAYRAAERIWVERGQRVRSLVTDTEWESLERSRLNAFFTSPDVVEAIWNGLLTLGLGDLTNPRILEPAAGVGRFLGLQPADTAARACRTAVELDALTARILKALYPRPTVHNLGFQDAPIRDEFFDVAISNIPFGDIPVVDRAFLKPGQRYLTRAIHNYFFAKALTKLRPGGVLAFITSRYTLDAPTAEPIRIYLHQQADLVVAIRLPAGTFPDTDVVTDFIILRKRLPAEPAGDDVWLRTVSQTYAYQRSPSGPSAPHLEDVHSDLNAYFVAHPQMVLGVHATTSVMYGGGGYTVSMPHGGRAAVIDALRDRMRALPGGLLAPAPSGVQTAPTPSPPVADHGSDLKEGAYCIQDDALWVCRGGQLVDPRLGPSQTTRLRELLAVRDAARGALRAQLDGAGRQAIEDTQRRLNVVYDRFVFRFGPLNSAPNTAVMGSDPDAFFLRALECWDTEAQQRHKTGRPVSEATARERLKMPLFRDIVVRQARPATSARSPKDAFLLVLNERGTLDFARIAELLGPGTTPDSVRDTLAAEGLIFEDPQAGWQTADAYLSGNVKRKLAVAEKAALAESRFQCNVEALRLVIPADIPPGQIEVRLGTHWIPATDVNDFLREVLHAEEPRWSRSGGQFVRYVAPTAEWVRETEPLIPAATNFGDWGTPRASALSIVPDLLNGRLPKVMDELEDGRRVINHQETLAAQEKGEALQRRFVEWLWSDADRAERLARYYNDQFNAIRPREYDGMHLTLPGSNPAFTLRPHQKAAVWRILQERAVGLFHEVGAGKTTVMAAAAMELRRLGLANKVLIVVPNDILQQFAEEFQRFYPLARLLVPSKDDFTPARRNEFMARIATGDWDAVIVALSQFTLLPVHPETEADFIQRELARYREALGELADEARERGERSWHSSEKSIQKAIARLSTRLETLRR